jgi:hypothetical protein
VYATRAAGAAAIDEAKLRSALTIRSRRRVSNDNVVSVDGVLWQLDQGFLAGQVKATVPLDGGIAGSYTAWGYPQKS